MSSHAPPSLSAVALPGMRGATLRRARSGRRAAWGGIAVVSALHAAGLYGLLQGAPALDPIDPATPLIVSFISAPAAVPETAPAQARPAPPSQPVVPKHAPPLIATASAIDSAPPEPAPRAPADATPSTPQAAPNGVPNAAPTAPAPAVIPPNFVAAYLDNPAPVYPPAARRVGETGKVLLRVLVGSDGRAERVDLHQGSGYARLDSAAVDAVARWRFVPARQGSQAVAAWVIVPIKFQIEG